MERQLMETDTFNLHCFLAPTGTKFFVTSAPRTAAVEHLLRTVYELYSDYVLKNPFYEVRACNKRRVRPVRSPGPGLSGPWGDVRRRGMEGVAVCVER
jgi:hypothetical protein